MELFFELSFIRNRREILSAPVHLQVESEGLFQTKGKPLVFTEIGITCSWFLSIKYDQILCYGWEFCSGFNATGILSTQLRKTLVLKSKGKGMIDEIRFKNRSGNSIFGTHGYFFDDTQIAKAEEIFKKAGVDKCRITIN